MVSGKLDGRLSGNVERNWSRAPRVLSVYAVLLVAHN